MTINAIAKAHYDLAVAWLDHADKAEDINSTIAYTGQAECAVKLAQFAVENPSLVAGVDEYGPPEIPPGTTRVSDEQALAALGESSGPTQGPKFWGAPS